MLTLIGNTTLVIKNPKVGNLETIDTGVAQNTSRQGVTGIALVSPKITKRRFDFEWMTLAERDELIAFLLAHMGLAITVQWSTSACDGQTINEQYLIDDQPLESVTVHDNCSYDCMTYWIKV